MAHSTPSRHEDLQEACRHADTLVRGATLSEAHRITVKALAAFVRLSITGAAMLSRPPLPLLSHVSSVSAACNDGCAMCAACVSAELRRAARPNSSETPFTSHRLQKRTDASADPSSGAPAPTRQRTDATAELASQSELPPRARIVPEPLPASRKAVKTLPRALSLASAPISPSAGHRSTSAIKPNDPSSPRSPARAAHLADSRPRVLRVEPSMPLISLIRAKKRAREVHSAQPELECSSQVEPEEPVSLVRSSSAQNLFGELAAMLTSGSATSSKPDDAGPLSDFVLPAREELLAQLEDLKSTWESLGGPN